MRDKLEFEWAAPDECPSRAHVLAEVERMAPRRIEREAHARVVVVAVSGEYRAHVTLRVGSAYDERDVEGTTCGEIADAAALLVALALAPEARPLESPPPSRPEAHPYTPGSSGRTVLHAKLHLGLGLGLEALALPRPISTVRPMLAVSSGSLLVGVEGQVSPRMGESLATEPNKGAYFRFFGARFAGCWLLSAGQFRAGPCLGVGIMGIGTEGFGVSRPRVAVTWTPNATAEARLSWSPTPRFEGILTIAAGAPTEALSFSVDSSSGSRRLHRLEPLTFAVGIGIARLWDLF